MDRPPPEAPGLPPPIRDGGAAPASTVRRVLGLALRLLGLALLAVVLVKVPWRDQLHLADGRMFRGEILGEEPDGAVRFRVAEDQPGGPREIRALPGDLADRERGFPPVEEGVLSLGRRLRAGPTILVLLLAGVGIAIAASRWRMLLVAQGILLTRREAVELTLLGNFFNQVAPGGIVGGDVLKALYAARGRSNPAGCFVGVFVDRVVGLFGTVVLAGVALAPRLGDGRFLGHALLAYGVLAAGLVGGFAVLSPRVRAILGLERWVPRLPLVGAFLAEADAAVLAYRTRKGSVALGVGVSVLIHAAWCVASALLGGMMGIDLTLWEWFAVVPPILVVSAIPLLPGGWGVGEASYAFFLGLLGVPAAPAVAVSILGRTLQIVAALPGGLVFLGRGAAKAAPVIPPRS